MSVSGDCGLSHVALSQDKLSEKRAGADHLGHGHSAGSGVIRSVLCLCQYVPSANRSNHCAMDQFQMDGLDGEAVEQGDGKQRGDEKEEEEQEWRRKGEEEAAVMDG